MFVVADAGPLRYLIVIDVVDILPRLFERVLIPDIVGAELSRPSTPLPVRAWLATAPASLEKRASPPVVEGLPPRLDAGERAAIELALSRRADLVLMDDRQGVAAATAAGLRAIGTIGILDRAALRGLVDLPAAVERLRATNFRCGPQMLDVLLAQHGAKKP